MVTACCYGYSLLLWLQPVVGDIVQAVNANHSLCFLTAVLCVLLQITAQELSDNRIITLTLSGRKLDKKVGSYHST